MERGLDRMGTAKSEANSPGMSWKCSYVQEPLKKKKKKKTFKRPVIFPLPWPLFFHSVKSLSTMRKHVNSLSVECISMESII